jgi:hypothetical protein
MIPMKLTRCCLLGFTIMTVGSLGARAAGDPELEAMWRDPTFKRQFVGSYGVNADIEPRVTPEKSRSSRRSAR